MNLRTKQADKQSIWADAREVPAAGVANPARVERRARWLRFALRASAVLLPLTLVALVLVLGSRGRPAVAAGADPAPNTQGRAAATLALQTWLAADPAPLPGAAIVSWDGAVTNTPPTTTAGGPPSTVTFPTQRDLFTIVDGSGRLYRAEMLIAVDPSGGAKALAGPSLTPVPDARAAGAGDEYSAWGALQPIAAPAPVESAVRAWAKAFTSGDGAALRLTVGDKDPSHAYLPMPAPQTTIVAVKQAAYLPADGGPSQMLVRVRLTLDYHPPAAGAPDKAQPNPPAVSFDVLVDGAGTAAPNVVAWGGPGSGPALSAYGNAVPADAPTSAASTQADPSTRPPPSATPSTSRPITTSPAPPG